MLGHGQVYNFSRAFGYVENSPVHHTLSYLCGSLQKFSFLSGNHGYIPPGGHAKAQREQGLAQAHMAGLHYPAKLDSQGPCLSHGAPSVREGPTGRQLWGLLCARLACPLNLCS
jgi:hypothetical protein